MSFIEEPKSSSGCRKTFFRPSLEDLRYYLQIKIDLLYAQSTLYDLCKTETYLHIRHLYIPKCTYFDQISTHRSFTSRDYYDFSFFLYRAKGTLNMITIYLLCDFYYTAMKPRLKTVRERPQRMSGFWVGRLGRFVKIGYD